MHIGVFLALLGTGGSLQAGGDGRTAADFAKTLKWSEKSKGPLLYLPYRMLQTPDRPQMEGGFQVFSSGTLHVIAPAQLTVIDPDYSQTPNIYDGLPRNLKVLYLASTFNASQWQTACTTGIGLNNLTREQQAVYRSILPSEFKYELSAVINPNINTGISRGSTETILTPDEESQVLLKIYKELTLGVQLGGGGFSAISAQDWDRHKIGTKIGSRVDSASEDKNSSFGIEVRKTSPNQSKPSDLDYKSSAYNMSFPLTPTSSVKEICQVASKLIHHTIVPDGRFQNEAVISIGSSARCGDVLKGLAL